VYDDEDGSEGTESAPLFERRALEILQRLHGHDSDEARHLVDELTRLLGTFRGWAAKAPTADERVRAVQRLFLLDREAIAIAASK
jgi:hypothetical protein